MNTIWQNKAFDDIRYTFDSEAISVAVFFFNLPLTVPHETLRKYLSVLSSDELDRYHNFKIPAVAERFVSSHACIRYILAALCDSAPETLEIAHTPNGKPYLILDGIYFSYSHSEQMVVIAVSRQFELGIDIESYSIVRDYNAISKRFFPISDSLLIDSSAMPKVEFLRQWTAREAVTKLKDKKLSDILSISFENLNALYEVIPFELPESAGRGSLALYKHKPVTCGYYRIINFF